MRSSLFLLLLAIPAIALAPHLDDVQAQLARASHAIARVAARVPQWSGAQRFLDRRNSFYGNRRPTAFVAEAASDKAAESRDR